jgi:hypothetical protein
MFLWHRNYDIDHAISIFIFWFSLMQLFEFFMWRNMKDHSFISKLSFVSILLQPFVLITSLYYFSLGYTKPSLLYTYNEKLVIFGVAALSLIKSLAGAVYAFLIDTKNKWLSVKGPHCHLMWWFIQHRDSIPTIARADYVYFLLLFIACAMIRPYYQGLFYLLIAIITCGLTYLFYPNETGSIWCWVVNLMGIFAIAMPYVKI